MLKQDTLGDSVEYLIPNLTIEVSFIDGVAVGMDLPQTVELTVVETEPGLSVGYSFIRDEACEARDRPGGARCLRLLTRAKRSA